VHRTLALLMLIPLAAATAAEEPKAGGPAAAKKTTAVQAAFRGKVAKFKARRITLEYDLTKEESFEDFFELNPFLAEPHGGFRIDAENGAIVGDGLGALCHKAVFEADVAISFTVVSPKPYDIGLTLLQPGLTDQFLLFSLADTFFSIKDRQTPRQHMITVVGAKDGGGGRGESLFRYLIRSKTPVLKAGREIEVEVLKRGNRNRFVFGKKTLSTEDRYGKFPEVQPAFFVLNSSMRITKLTIKGKLTEAWLKKHEIPWDPKEVDKEKLPEIKVPRQNRSGKDPTGRRGGSRDRGGTAFGGRGLIGRLSDSSLDEKDRQKAADGLTKDNVKKDEFRGLIDCLYKTDLTTRTLAIKVLKRVTGKTLGYHPKAPENSREKAIRAWWKYLRDNRERFA